jgi:hypothetical protein
MLRKQKRRARRRVKTKSKSLKVKREMKKRMDTYQREGLITLSI